MISAVTTNFGMAERRRSMGIRGVRGEEISANLRSSPRKRGRRARSEDLDARFRGHERSSNWPRLDLEAFDVVPQRAVLALVGRPDLLLRDFAEFVDLGLDHRHAERLEFRLRLGEVVDPLGGLAALGLRLASEVEHQLL